MFCHFFSCILDSDILCILYEVLLVSLCVSFFFFFFKQKTAYEMLRSLVGSEMCIRDSYELLAPWFRGLAPRQGGREQAGSGPELTCGRHECCCQKKSQPDLANFVGTGSPAVDRKGWRRCIGCPSRPPLGSSRYSTGSSVGKGRSSTSSRRSWPRPGRSSTGTGASTLGCSQRTARSGTSWNRRLHFSAPCGCTLHSSTQTCPGWVGLRLLYPVLLGAKLSNMQSKRVYLSTLPQYCIVAYLNTATLAKAFPAFSPWLAFLGFWAVFIGLGQFPRSLFET
eukprot:TRINITY_DN3462_c0_g1_i9.p1 TRINITY_DN3462_c0_g1~~TRINITY_DN3462_c0_g1_i9.p1  ORF type:complete len:281 (-),score=20.64 TRINITY_DN3462_c0_g1_i9:336-1178(-)